jgi:Activator of Hsp90 ATPase homolog 1-like protein
VREWATFVGIPRVDAAALAPKHERRDFDASAGAVDRRRSPVLFTDGVYDGGIPQSVDVGVAHLAREGVGGRSPLAERVVDDRLRIRREESFGKRGCRTFTRIDDHQRFTYDARSWTEGEELTTTIRRTNDVTLTDKGGTTKVTLHVAITEIVPKAKMAAFGMQSGYKSQLDALGRHLGH